MSNTLNTTPVVAIANLRTQGYLVNVRHLRAINYVHPLPLMTSYRAKHEVMPETHLRPSMFAPRGGRTEVEIVREGSIVAFGATNCSPRDNYCKAVGLQIALGRALKELPSR